MISKWMKWHLVITDQCLIHLVKIIPPKFDKLSVNLTFLKLSAV